MVFTENVDEGSPAYIVVGKVSLGEVVRAPLDDADRNLPNEVAKLLLPVAKELYGPVTRLASSGIKPLLEEFKLMDMPYHEYDPKVGRRYITREGLSELESNMRKEPLRALRCFGAKGHVKAFEGKLGSDMPQMDSVYLPGSSADPTAVV